MPVAADAYELLGVDRTASMAQIRRAYRNAVLKCHPDSHPDDPDTAAKRFSQLTEAYQAASQRFRERVTASEGYVGRLHPGEYPFGRSRPRSARITRTAGGRPGRQSTQEYSCPSLNETRTFVGLWALALVLSLAVMIGYPTIRFYLPGNSQDDLNTVDVLIIAVLPFGIYASVLTGAIVALTLTRTIILVVAQIKPRIQRALPGKREKRQHPTSP